MILQKTENPDFLKIIVFPGKNHGFQGSGVKKKNKKLSEKHAKNLTNVEARFLIDFNSKINEKTTRNRRKNGYKT